MAAGGGSRCGHDGQSRLNESSHSIQHFVKCGGFPSWQCNRNVGLRLDGTRRAVHARKPTAIPDVVPAAGRLPRGARGLDPAPDPPAAAHAKAQGHTAVSPVGSTASLKGPVAACRPLGNCPPAAAWRRRPPPLGCPGACTPRRGRLAAHARKPTAIPQCSAGRWPAPATRQQSRHVGRDALVGELKEEATAAGRRRGTFAGKGIVAQRPTIRPPRMDADQKKAATRRPRRVRPALAGPLRRDRCCWFRRVSRAAAGPARRVPGTTRSRRCWWHGRPRAPGSWP